MFASRNQTQNSLEKAYTSTKSEFIVLYSRPQVQVDRSQIISKFFRDKNAILLKITGTEDGGVKKQLKGFVSAVASCFPYVILPSIKKWSEAFELLRQLVSVTKSPVVIFFDEYSLMARKKSLLPMELEKYWVEYFSKLNNVKIVISSSSQSKCIKDMLQDHGLLHERATYRIDLSLQMFYEPNDNLFQLAIKRSLMDDKTEKEVLRNKLSDALEKKEEAILQQVLRRSLRDTNPLAIKLCENASKYGFSCRNVPEDGNCFFHAALHQLKLKNYNKYKNYTFQQIREIVVQHIIDYLDFYQGYMDEKKETFIDRMMENGEWADGIVVAAFSRAFNVDLIMIRSDNSAPTVMKRERPELAIYLGYEVGRHYQSLEVNNDIKATQRINLNVEVDNFENDVKKIRAYKTVGSQLKPANHDQKDIPLGQNRLSFFTHQKGLQKQGVNAFPSIQYSNEAKTDTKPKVGRGYRGDRI